MCFSITSDNIVIGIVMLMATVAIREEVKKQPQSHKASEMTVPKSPLMNRKVNCSFVGHSKISILVTCNSKNTGQSNRRLNKPTKPKILNSSPANLTPQPYRKTLEYQFYPRSEPSFLKTLNKWHTKKRSLKTALRQMECFLQVLNQTR